VTNPAYRAQNQNDTDLECDVTVMGTSKIFIFPAKARAKAHTFDFPARFKEAKECRDGNNRSGNMQNTFTITILKSINHRRLSSEANCFVFMMRTYILH
jgi:hypothetical protein